MNSIHDLTTYNPTRSVRIDSWDRLIFLGSQRLVHLDRQCKGSYRFSNKHHVLSGQDGTVPEMLQKQKFD